MATDRGKLCVMGAASAAIMASYMYGPKEENVLIVDSYGTVVENLCLNRCQVGVIANAGVHKLKPCSPGIYTQLDYPRQSRGLLEGKARASLKVGGKYGPDLFVWIIMGDALLVFTFSRLENWVNVSRLSPPAIDRPAEEP